MSEPGPASVANLTSDLLVERGECVIGLMLVHESEAITAFKAAGGEPSDFEAGHDRIVTAILDAHAAGQATDAKAITLRMAGDAWQAELGTDYLVNCARAAPSFADVEEVRSRVCKDTKTIRWARERTKPGEVAAKPDARRFKITPLADIHVSRDRNYLVKRLIPREGLVVVWGPPKCGKSFWTLDLALHVSLGWEYRGHNVQQGPVVYIALEGASGYGARIEAFLRRNPQASLGAPFHLLPTRLDLIRDYPELIEAIAAHLGDGSQKPVAVVLDTLNRSLVGSEFKDEDMGAYIDAADAIRAQFTCAVIIVHHCGVDGTRPRGHTSLGGAVDAQLAVRKDNGGNVVVEVEWMKDGPEGETIASQLETVDVAIDEDGDPISSCVVVASDYQAEPDKRGTVLSAKNQIALVALTDLINRQGEPLPPSLGLPGSIQAVREDAWKEELAHRSIIAGTGSTRRMAYLRLGEGLTARGFIARRDGMVWLVKVPG